MKKKPQSNENQKPNNKPQNKRSTSEKQLQKSQSNEQQIANKIAKKKSNNDLKNTKNKADQTEKTQPVAKNELPKKEKKKRGRAFKVFKIVSLSLIFVTLGAILTGMLYMASVSRAAHLDPTLLPSAQAKTIYFDRNGEVIGSAESDFCSADEIPENLKNAFIAVEDKRFYKHNGIDMVRIGRAALTNIKSGSYKEGGSTISQQLIKNTHLTTEKTFKRKSIEAKIAKELEKSYEKDEILSMYLSVIYFGQGNYGVKQAARSYFDKSLDELTLSECACIAGIVKSPNVYSPAANLEKSTERRNLVLDTMKKENYLSFDECEAAKAEALVLNQPKESGNPAHVYIAAAKAEAMRRLNISSVQLESLGAAVYTYYDATLQAELSKLLCSENLKKANENGLFPEVLGIVADNNTGGIAAYCSDVPNGIVMRRQAGSALKPFSVYAPALEYGVITASTPVLDEPTDFYGFSPKNYNDVYYGQTTAREAVAKSMNVAAVKFLNYLGADRSLNFLKNAGFTLSDADANLSLALGSTSAGTTPFELLSAYTMLAHGGLYKEPSFIADIVIDGKLLDLKKTPEKRIISPENAYILTDMLKDTVKQGTARSLSGLQFDVAAKTGTVGNATGNSDAWSASYTPSATVLLWHGNASGETANQMSLSETGGSYVTAIARELYKSALKCESGTSFTRPSGVVSAKIDEYSLKNLNELLLADESTPSAYVKDEIFSAETLPNRSSYVFKDICVANFAAEYKNRTVSLSFDAKEFVAYDIFKIDKAGNHTHLGTIKGKNGRQYFESYLFPSNETYIFEVVPRTMYGENQQSGEAVFANIYAKFDPTEFITENSSLAA